MKKLFTLLNVFVLMMFLSSSVQAQFTQEWKYQFQLPGNTGIGNGVVCMPSGKTISVANVTDASTISRGVLLFLDESGQLLDFDSTSVLQYQRIMYDENKYVYAGGSANNNMLIARFDTNFSDKHYFILSNVSNPYVADLTSLSNSNIVVASTWLNNNFSNSPALICLDSTGQVLWSYKDTTIYVNESMKLAADFNGGFYVACSGTSINLNTDCISISHFNSSGVCEWTFNIYGTSNNGFAKLNDILVDDLGCIYVAGNFLAYGGCLVKLDISGNIIWNRFPFENYQKIIPASQGNIYGLKSSQYEFAIDKLNSSGTRIDSSNFQYVPGHFHSSLSDMKMLSNGNIATSGSVQDTASSRMDLFIGVFDSLLNLIGYDIIDSFCAGSDFNLMAANNDSGFYISAGFYTAANNQLRNPFILKYSLTGNTTLVNRIDQGEFELFPNPSSGNVTFSFRNELMRNSILRIMNTTGKEVFNQSINASAIQYDLKLNLASGIYFVILETGDEKFISRLCIAE